MSSLLGTCRNCRTISNSVEMGYCFDCVNKMRNIPANPGLEQSTITTHITPDDAKFIRSIQKTFENHKDTFEKLAKSDQVKPKVAGKPSISLIPREAIFEMAKAFDYGTGKHGRYAFREGVEFSKLLDAAMRHILAMTDGEDVDEESGSLHAASAMCNLSMLIFMMKQKPEFDDRWKKGTK